MTKNVSFRFLSFKLKNANLDYFRIVVKMSETNHIKKLKKSPKFLLAVYRNKKNGYSIQLTTYRSVYLQSIPKRKTITKNQFISI